MQAIILASSSLYRAELLGRFGRPIESVAPDIDESVLPHESAPETAIRLARMKAERVATHRTGGVVIGSDQVPFCASEIPPGTDPSHSPHLGKPGSLEAARSQLKFLSGKRVHFFTALCLIDIANGQRFSSCDETVVSMRHLERDEIERYLARESVLDCAGSFKAEGLGISLFDSIESVDPTALVGLPLISVAQGLRKLGITIP